MPSQLEQRKRTPPTNTSVGNEAPGPSTSSPTALKIAVASSGLGHISRGIETWAADLWRALRRTGADATLFQGAGTSDETARETLTCWKRFDPHTQKWVRRMTRFGGWRYGFGGGYQLEQTTFTLKLWRRIRKDYDILHVQDPYIALLMEKLHRKGLSRPRVILAHGTEEPTAYLQRFSWLQHLAPCYLDDWETHRPAHQAAFAVPNFVNLEQFSPADAQARLQARSEWDIPSDAFVVLSVAAIKKHHKRIDYLLHEFSRFAEQQKTQDKTNRPSMLVVAGGRENETEEVIALGKELLGERVRFLQGVPREKITGLYRTADVFALASKHEMMPIALLEALASGLPIACNATPTLRWMTGPAGRLNDITVEGAMAQQLLELSDPVLCAELSRQARYHAEQTFSEPIVMKQVFAMYEQVSSKKS